MVPTDAFDSEDESSDEGEDEEESDLDLDGDLKSEMFADLRFFVFFLFLSIGRRFADCQISD